MDGSSALVRLFAGEQSNFTSSLEEGEAAPPYRRRCASLPFALNHLLFLPYRPPQVAIICSHQIWNPIYLSYYLIFRTSFSGYGALHLAVPAVPVCLLRTASFTPKMQSLMFLGFSFFFGGPQTEEFCRKVCVLLTCFPFLFQWKPQHNKTGAVIP